MELSLGCGLIALYRAKCVLTLERWVSLQLWFW